MILRIRFLAVDTILPAYEFTPGGSPLCSDGRGLVSPMLLGESGQLFLVIFLPLQIFCFTVFVFLRLALRAPNLFLSASFLDLGRLLLCFFARLTILSRRDVTIKGFNKERPDGSKS